MGRYDKILNDADETLQAKPSAPEPRSGSRYSMETLFPPPTPPSPAATVTHRGAILPFTTYSDKSVRFEPTESGLLSYPVQSAKSGGRLVKEAMTTGAPPAMGEVLNAASLGVGLNPFVRSGDRAIPGIAGVKADMRMARTPTSEELKQAGGQQLNAVRQMPVGYNPQSLGDLANIVEHDLVNQYGVFPENSKQLYKTLNRWRNAPEGAIVTPNNLMAMRENLATLFTKPKEHQKGVGVAFEHLNNFIEGPPASAVLAGPAADVGAAYAKGRANYAAGMRGEGLADIQRTADLARSAANSGQNLDNSLRQRVKSLVLNDKAMRGFVPAEEQALEQVVLGAEGANIRRAAGNMLGGGGGLGAAVTSGLAGAGANFLGAGPAATGLAVTSVPLLGGYLKNRAAARTAGALQDIEEATRRRSPLFLEQPGPDVAPNISFGRDMLTRAAMQSQAGQTQQSVEPSQPLRITVTPWDRYDPENRL
jgi:hypothetical protein